MAVPRAFARLPADRPAYPGRHTERLLSADEQIPPVRQLAMEAGVNPNTMQRALSALEDEGLLVSRGTVGRFVTSDEAALERARRTARQDALEKLAEDGNCHTIARIRNPEYANEVQYIREEVQSAAIPSDDPDPHV